MFFNLSLNREETILLRQILDVYFNALVGNFKPLVESLDSISSNHVAAYNPNITNALFNIIREQTFGLKPDELFDLDSIDSTAEFAMNKAKELWKFLIKTEFSDEISSLYSATMHETRENSSTN
jgi:hypothetical protein